MFIQDPFSPVLFREDADRYVDVKIVYYNYQHDILKLRRR